MMVLPPTESPIRNHGPYQRGQHALPPVNMSPQSTAHTPRSTHSTPRSTNKNPATSRTTQINNGEESPVRSTLPRENSTIISRVVVDDPSEDIAREQARVAESHPIGPSGHANFSNAIDGSSQANDVTRTPAKRQDFSNEKNSKRENALGEYILGQTLGEGEFGKVKMGWKKGIDVQVAVKIIRREKLSDSTRLAKVYREIAILRGLNHPNIVRLHEMVETERTIGIILEYASGGELFDYILHHRYLRDQAARRLFAQLVSGVGYLHRNGIIHRDLKLENLLLDRNKNIIISDFGFANTFDPNDVLGDEIEKHLEDRSFVKKHNLETIRDNGFRRGDLMATSCGSPCYAAPELVVSDGIYTGRKVDVWSCGVILYAMLAGYLPFDDDPANPEGDNINLLYRYITNTPLVFPEYVTPHARDLLRRILVPDPRKRADLFEVARHSWLAEYAHVVDFITSSSTPALDPSSAHINDSNAYPRARSASLRDTAKAPKTSSPAPVGGLLPKARLIDASEDNDRARAAREAKRRTVQLEYVAPQSSTARGEIFSGSSQPRVQSQYGNARDTSSQFRNIVPGAAPLANEGSATTPAASSMAPPSLPEPSSRSVSDTIGGPSIGNQASANRPSTGVAMSGARLPSRNSYGLPAAATVATTNAEGRFSKSYATSPTLPQGEPSAVGPTPFGNVTAVPQPPPSAWQQNQQKRSSTLGTFGDRLFRSNSSSRQNQNERRQKSDRSHPPSSMKPVEAERQPRPSTESRRSFGFVRKSADMGNSDMPVERKRTSRRLSGLLNRFSFHQRDPSPPRGVEYQPDTRNDSRPASKHITKAPPSSYSRREPTAPYMSPPQTVSSAQYDGARDQPLSYPPSSYPRPMTQAPPATAGQQSHGGGGQPSQEQGSHQRGQKRFDDEHDRDHRHGAARRVMDFFRRRSKTRDMQ